MQTPILPNIEGLPIIELQKLLLVRKNICEQRRNQNRSIELNPYKKAYTFEYLDCKNNNCEKCPIQIHIKFIEESIIKMEKKKSGL